MPRLSDSMEEGTILKWLKSDGDVVAAGEDLVEIETDKATMTYASDHDGTLQIVAAEGSSHAVGEIIARVGAAAESTPEPEPVPTPERDGHQHNGREPQPAGRGPQPAGREPQPAAREPEPAGREPVAEAQVMTVAATSRATPLARRVASEHRVDLEGLTGTGPRGRITRADVLASAGVKAPPTLSKAPAQTPVTPEVVSSDSDSQIQIPSRVQQVIAQRMAAAHATIPSFEVQTEAAMDAALALRSGLKDVAGEDPVPSINDLLIKACALALRRHPRVNASYTEGRFELHPRVNVGFAVAAEEALIVPTVHDADTKSLGAIARETRELAERVRSGKITPTELSGATFTVSNLGMYGVTAIRPVINPPQVSILGVGAARQVLVRSEGEIVDRTLATLTLSSDHRILYGADAARFLADVQALIEAPLRLAL
jgi:pyruvate dehydrogenase E2 component (dihydrolipoamide acetyltransferase)